tara:strand:+ start:355 stop:1698 length:1344 start_codon:yes stop_codon:yes gene_type:complete
MLNIIEKSDQFLDFIENYRNSDSIIIPVFGDYNLHPLNTTLSLIFIRILGGSDYMLCYDHSESLKLSMDTIKSLNCAKTLYTNNKRKLSHIIELDNIVDINMKHYLQTNKPIDFSDCFTPTHNHFHSQYYSFKNLNLVIPILKHYEFCDVACKKMENNIKSSSINKVFDIYNKDVIDNLVFIEKSGLKVNSDLIGLQNKKHISTDGLVYTEYNPYTSTGRPSNRFGGINFSALNKEDGSRKPFISRFDNGALVEFDYDSYHLRLIADIIGYDFPEGSVHKYLGKQYGIDDYKESKAMSFKLLYGGIPKEISDNIPFFGEVDKYIQTKWNEYKKSFSVDSDIYNRKLLSKNLTNMNKNKLFNYLIQLGETENNMVVLKKLRKFLDKFTSKVILYQYDSFLFDFNLDDGKQFLIDVKNILEQDGKYPVKVGYGCNYHEMKDFTEKLNGI